MKRKIKFHSSKKVRRIFSLKNKKPSVETNNYLNKETNWTIELYFIKKKNHWKICEKLFRILINVLMEVKQTADQLETDHKLKEMKYLLNSFCRCFIAESVLSEILKTSLDDDEF